MFFFLSKTFFFFFFFSFLVIYLFSALLVFSSISLYLFCFWGLHLPLHSYLSINLHSSFDFSFSFYMYLPLYLPSFPIPLSPLTFSLILPLYQSFHLAKKKIYFRQCYGHKRFPLSLMIVFIFTINIVPSLFIIFIYLFFHSTLWYITIYMKKHQ